MDQAPLKQNSLSPKWAFILGLLAGLAIFSLIAFILLAANYNLLKEIKINKPAAQGNEQPTPSQPQGIESKIVGPVGTFYEVSEPVCQTDGKPAVYMFSTSWCPHCQWVKAVFEKAVKGYVQQGKITAHNWELDLNDDALTPEKESSVPPEQLAVYEKYNPEGTIPTFVFGCKYFRVGTGYERSNDKAAEEKEFKEIIEKLLK